MHINLDNVNKSPEEIEYIKSWIRFSLYKEIEEYEKSLSQEEIVKVLKAILNSYMKNKST